MIFVWCIWSLSTSFSWFIWIHYILIIIIIILIIIPMYSGCQSHDLWLWKWLSVQWCRQIFCGSNMLANGVQAWWHRWGLDVAHAGCATVVSRASLFSRYCFHVEVGYGSRYVPASSILTNVYPCQFVSKKNILWLIHSLPLLFTS